jgi:hypothetical protein
VKSIARYVANHGITVEILSGPNTEISEDGWEHYAYELKLLNANLGTEMTLPWKVGLGITEDPDDQPEIILDCLISDVWGYALADSFEDWAGEYGYSTDSRKAWKLWESVRKQTSEFLRLIGGAAELEKLALKYERL